MIDEKPVSDTVVLPRWTSNPAGKRPVQYKLTAFLKKYKPNWFGLKAKKPRKKRGKA